MNRHATGRDATIIVPVLNEGQIIGKFLAHLRDVVSDEEIIVVDGGSGDDTAPIAARHAPVIVSAPGRARQMNSGAAVARGNILWFLHADSTLPDRPIEQIKEALKDPAVVGGCFRLRLPARGLAYRICDDLGNIAVDIFKLACGDHGIFVRRGVFEAVGGYPDVPLIEDLELCRRMRRAGRFVQLRSYVVSQPRRWFRNGPYRTTGMYLLLLSLYFCGAPMPVLTRLYKRLK